MLFKPYQSQEKFFGKALTPQITFSRTNKISRNFSLIKYKGFFYTLYVGKLIKIAATEIYNGMFSPLYKTQQYSNLVIPSIDLLYNAKY